MPYTGYIDQGKNSTNNIAQTIDALFTESGAALNALSQGDLSNKIEGEYEGDFENCCALEQKNGNLVVKSVISDLDFNKIIQLDKKNR